MIVSTDWTRLPLGVRGRQVGVDYEYELGTPPVRFTFSAVRETRNGLRAEVRVDYIEPGAEGDILQEQITLISLRSKNGFAKALETRTKLAIAWEEIVELVALATTDTFREGDPFVFLKDVTDQPLDRAFLIRYFLPYLQSTVLYSDGMAGKSLLALLMGIAVASGQELPGMRPLQEAQSVLYLDWETTAPTHAYYLRCIERAHALTLPREAILYRRMSRSLQLEAHRIKREIDNHQVGLLIVDSMVPACGGEPESAAVVMSFFNAIRMVGPITALIISHLTKLEAHRKGLPRPFGSVFTTNLARSTWLARRAELGSVGILDVGMYHTKTNFGRLQEPRGLRFRFTQDNIALSEFSLEDVPELGAHVPLSRRVRGILKRGPATTSTIADALAASSDSVSKSLRRMKDVIVVKGDSSGGRGKVKTWALKTYAEDPFPHAPQQQGLDDFGDVADVRFRVVYPDTWIPGQSGYRERNGQPQPI